MFKKILLGSLVSAQLLMILVISAMFFLAEVYPFHPGELLYPAQNAGEQARLSLTGGRSSKASFALVLAERRLADLAQAADPQAVQASVSSFESSLKTAATALDEAPQGAQEALYARLEIILGQADVVVHSLGDRVDLALLQDLYSRIALSQKAQTPVEVQALLLSEIPAEVVPFYTQDVDHSKFGLFGGHYSIDCMSCHQSGEYASTNSECSSCHQPKVYQQYIPEVYGNRMIAYQGESQHLQATQLYPDHYAGECSDCHSIYTWEPVAFDHSSVFECLSCHSKDIPADRVENNVLVSHYPGDCKQCHSNFSDWQMTEYGHDGVKECESCHSMNTPASHYSGQCSNCHLDIQDWQVVVFDHSNRQDCSSCHSLDAPENHYGGQCSNCHSTEDWSYGVFGHPSGANCSTCHMKPAEHYKEACASCHNPTSGSWQKTTHTENQDCTKCHNSPVKHYEGIDCTTCHAASMWSVSSFDHEVADIACTDCHVEEEPLDHYQSVCQDCHNTGSWESYVFNHTGYSACQDCHLPVSSSHYPGICSDCHNTTDWIQVEVDHTNMVDCLTCHQTPVEHYPGTCSDCHNTYNWIQIEVDHTYMYDCLSCHETPDGHWPGQCSSCHVVNDWSEINFDHTTYTDCKACHMRPAGHPRGQCSNCHTTDSWLNPTETPLPTVTPNPEENLLPLPPEDENEYGLPLEWVPYFTPKPTSTPVISDVRATPTVQPTEDPRDVEKTPTPEPTEDPGVMNTPVPAPVEPDPEPVPVPDAGGTTQSTPSPSTSQEIEAAPVAMIPNDHKLVIEQEDPA